MKSFRGKSVTNFQPDQTTSCNKTSQDAFRPLLFLFSRLDFDRCLTVRTNNFYPVFSENTRRRNDNSRVLMRLSLQLRTAWHGTCFW